MGRGRTYGARKQQASAAASAIFGKATRSSSSPTKVSTRAALADITESLQNVHINSVAEEIRPEEVEESLKDTNDSASTYDVSEDSYQEEDETQKQLEDELQKSLLNSENQHLQPLTDAYAIDTGYTLTSFAWADVLPADCTVVKIAEASYAEVYRITIPSGETSIIKIMRIDSPHDLAGSESGTAIKVENIVSEVRIMNTLTELPGFVRFKDAHILRGKSVQAFIDAYEARERIPKIRESQFPHPEEYTEESEFLAIELGDAGEVLEDFPVTSIDQVWDIFIGTVMALAKGEMANEFEHRDLHENNICVSVSPHVLTRSDPDLKLGSTGIKVTLIDYGLSRATLQNGEVVFFNLEEDPEIFQGTDGHPQFNAYRRMRTNLLTSERTSKTKAWHASQSATKSWSEFTPYSNVIWIGYMLGYLKKDFKKNSKDAKGLKKFNEETTELSRRLDSRTKIENGAFSTATDVLYYCIESGWVSKEQAEEYGADMSSFFES